MWCISCARGSIPGSMLSLRAEGFLVVVVDLRALIDVPRVGLGHDTPGVEPPCTRARPSACGGRPPLQRPYSHPLLSQWLPPALAVVAACPHGSRCPPTQQWWPPASQPSSRMPCRMPCFKVARVGWGVLRTRCRTPRFKAVPRVGSCRLHGW